MDSSYSPPDTPLNTNNVWRRRTARATGSLGEEENTTFGFPHENQDEANQEYEAPNIFDFIDAQGRRRPLDAEPGPPDPVLERPGVFSRLFRSSNLLWMLPIAAFLLGWVAKDTSVSFAKIHSHWELDKLYQLHREEIQAERIQWALERKQWADESEKREQTRLAERQLELEKLKIRNEKEREEEEHEKARMRWAPPQPDPRCLRYGTRAWTAKLENIPKWYNPATACYKTKALIHGRMLLPDFCETDTRAGTFGTWHVNFTEAACCPRWSPITDKGCTSEGSGKRKFEAQLEGLRAGDNWRSMCSSTPAEFNGLRFDGPHSCDDRGIWGYRGFWFVEDNVCT